jgi:hypothetical protein
VRKMRFIQDRILPPPEETKLLTAIYHSRTPPAHSCTAVHGLPSKWRTSGSWSKKSGSRSLHVRSRQTLLRPPNPTSRASLDDAVRHLKFVEMKVIRGRVAVVGYIDCVAGLTRGHMVEKWRVFLFAGSGGGSGYRERIVRRSATTLYRSLKSFNRSVESVPSGE